MPAVNRVPRKNDVGKAAICDDVRGKSRVSSNGVDALQNATVNLVVRMTRAAKPQRCVAEQMLRAGMWSCYDWHR